MESAKCLARFAYKSKRCNDFLNKNLIVLTALVNEPEGLRVSDIHEIYQGSKYWICNILLKLERFNLTARVKYDDKREVYYKLTEKGEEVATNGLHLMKDLLKHEGIEVLEEFNSTYFIFRNDLANKAYSGRRKVYKNKLKMLPVHKYEGSLIINNEFLTFIGKDTVHQKFFFSELIKDDIQNIIFDYDEYFKGRYGFIFSKPVRIDFKNDGDKFDSVYIFAEWSKSLRKAKKNKELFQVLKNFYEG